MSITKAHASTILNYSPQKTRLVINVIRGMQLDLAMDALKKMNKPKAKKIYFLLKNAAVSNGLTESDYKNHKIQAIVAEEAQTYKRIVPRARGSAFQIRRRYSRIKVQLSNI